MQPAPIPFRVGLIGSGGRGTGAARDCAVSAPGVEIVAMADLFRDRLEERRERSSRKPSESNYKVNGR